MATPGTLYITVLPLYSLAVEPDDTSVPDVAAEMVCTNF